MVWGRARGLWAIDRADERRALEGVIKACRSMSGLIMRNASSSL